MLILEYSQLQFTLLFFCQILPIFILQMNVFSKKESVNSQAWLKNSHLNILNYFEGKVYKYLKLNYQQEQDPVRF